MKLREEYKRLDYTIMDMKFWITVKQNQRGTTRTDIGTLIKLKFGKTIGKEGAIIYKILMDKMALSDVDTLTKFLEPNLRRGIDIY